MVPLWFFSFLLNDVWQYGFPDLAGGGREQELKGSGEAVVDIPGAVGLGVYGRDRAGLGGSVQFWILWTDADVAAHRACGDGAL